MLTLFCNASSSSSRLRFLEAILSSMPLGSDLSVDVLPFPRGTGAFPLVISTSEFELLLLHEVN